MAALDADNLADILAAARNNNVAQRKVDKLSSTGTADWLVWKRKFDGAVRHNQWNDQRQREEIQWAMTDEAARMTYDIDILDPRTIDEVVADYEARFIPAAGGQVARAELSHIRQRVDENTNQFHGRVREIYNRAYPGENVQNSQQCIEKFVLGLMDIAITRFILDRAPATYAEALRLAQMKTASEMTLALRPDAQKTAIHNLQQTNAAIRPGQGRAGFRKADSDKADKACWHCQSRQHVRSNCLDFWKSRDSRPPHRGRGGRRHFPPGMHHRPGRVNALTNPGEAMEDEEEEFSDDAHQEEQTGN